MMAIPLVMVSGFSATSTSTDLPIFMLGVVISIRLFKLLFYDTRIEEILFDTIFIIILSVTGISIKLSFVVFGCMVSLVAIIKLVICNQGRKANYQRLRKLFWGAGFALLLLAPWGARSIMLSGYLIYPSPQLSVDVAWKIPLERVVNEERWVKSWARQQNRTPDEVLGTGDWIVPWAQRILAKSTTPIELFLPGLLFLVGLLLFIKWRKIDRERLLWCCLFLFPPIVSLLFWFVIAPDVRFAGVSFWMLGAGLFVISIQNLEKPGYLNRVNWLTIILVIMTFLAGVWYKGFIVPPGPIHGFYPSPPVQTEPYQTRSGLLLNVPVGDDKCWDAPLPCTPYPDPDLRLIEEGDLASGFILDRP